MNSAYLGRGSRTYLVPKVEWTCSSESVIRVVIAISGGFSVTEMPETGGEREREKSYPFGCEEGGMKPMGCRGYGIGTEGDGGEEWRAVNGERRTRKITVTAICPLPFLGKVEMKMAASR